MLRKQASGQTYQSGAVYLRTAEKLGVGHDSVAFCRGVNDRHHFLELTQALGDEGTLR